MAEASTAPFQNLLRVPIRNGLTRPKAVRGAGVKMVNMGEIFTHDRIQNVRMDRVPLDGKERERSLLERGDLLFARQSLVLEGAGKCSVFLGDKEPVTFESHLIRARLDPAIADPLFFFYFFRSPVGRDAIRSIVEQVAAAGIRGRDLANLPVPHIPVRQQRAIAHILGTLDDKIELNRRMNEALEAMAQAIFKSWFVDFDPVRAKAEGREPGLPEHIADLFPDRFEDSELGEIPAGWDVESLDEIAHFLNGLALQKYPPETDEYLPAIKIAELRKGVTESSGKASINIPPKYVVEDGDILFSWSGSLEVQLWTGGRGALNQHLFKVTSEKYPKWFPYFWLKLHLPEFRNTAAGKATTMGHIKRHHLTDALVLVPPVATIQAMDATMAPVMEKVFVNRLEARALAAIRDALLPQLISGELRVRESSLLEGTD